MFRSLLISSVVNTGPLEWIPSQKNIIGNQSKTQKLPKPSTYKTKFVLIPENVDLLTLLANNPPLVKQCNDNLYTQGEKCAVILSLIINAYYKAEKAKRISYKGFANVSAHILQKHVKDYNEYIKFLMDAGIIVSDNHYITNEKSIGYKLTPQYINAPLKEYPILDHMGNAKSGAAIFKNLSNATSEQKIADVKYPELYQDLLSVTVTDKHEAKNYIYKDLYNTAYASAVETLKSNHNGTYTDYNKLSEVDKKSYIQPNIIRKCNAWYASLHELDQNRAYFNQDKTSFRLHTSVLGVNSKCRHFLRLQGKHIISCDLKNSQPFISAFFFTPGNIDPELNKILKNCFSNIEQQNKPLFRDIMKRIRYYKKGNILPSTKKYIKLVQSGEIYEYIAINIGVFHSIKRNKNIYYNREHGKNCVFKLFFNPTIYGALVRDFFRVQFQQVASLFEDINKLFTHTRRVSESKGIPRSKNTLAITLQTIESHLMIDVICRDLKDKYPHIPLLTIHDAIASNPEYKDVLLEEMRNTLTSKIGIVPSIKEEDWSVPVIP
ncbi:MAG: hypothetical protein IPL08_05825 [Saprospiraceae bacterium]|nr:hypothetical protein [Saprospiraceae bacterium]